MNMYTHFKILLVLAAVSGLFVFSVQKLQAKGETSQELAAKGDGVRVTMDFVRKVQAYYQQNSTQRAHRQEYIRSGVEHWLFAREAIEQGLHEKDKEMNDLSDMSGKEIVVLHHNYLRYQFDQEKDLDEDVLRSYYLAFPHKFTKSSRQKADETQNGTQGNEVTVLMAELEEPKPVPFEDVKEDIRRKLVGLKMSEIRQQTFERLVDEYNIEIFND